MILDQIEHFQSKSLPTPTQNAIRTKKYNNPYDEMNRSKGSNESII